MMSKKTAFTAAIALAAALGGSAPQARAQTPVVPASPSPATQPAQTETREQPTKPAQPPPAPAALPRTQRPLDIVVTVTMANGKSETFAHEIDRMEIITQPGGRLEMVHLVLVAGGERNTHVWYNFSEVAKLSYRFVTAEGKSRVKVRVIQSAPPLPPFTERLEPLGPGAYR